MVAKRHWFDSNDEEVERWDASFWRRLHPFLNNGCVAVPLPTFFSESIPSELMRLAREDVESDFHRLVLADWLEQRGDADAIELSRILRMSFGCDSLVLLENSMAERFRPLAGARRGWFCGPWNGDETSLERLWLASPRTIELPSGNHMELEYIPAGTFMMGSPETESEKRPNEILHDVTTSKPFYIGKYPVTKAQWSRFVEVRSYRSEAETSGGAFFWIGNEWNLDPKRNWRNPGYDQGPKHPVVCVSWNDAQALINWLNSLGQSNPTVLRLPTEAECEYACRAGTTTPFHFGKALNGTQANCDGRYPYGTTTKGPYLQKTSAVGSYLANAWGLYDMHGNVWEWCSDWYGKYPVIGVTDSQGPYIGKTRVLRGGSWLNGSKSCRASFRLRDLPGNRYNSLGFRVLLPLDF